MDQLKKLFAKAIQHQFWIMIGVAVITSSLAWYMTQSSLQKLYNDQESLIKSKFSALEQVKSALPTHPNQSSKTEMDRMIGSLSQDVQTAWEEQYQRQSDYLKWPDIGLDRLINKLKEYYPVELHPKLSYPDQPKDIVEGDKTAFSKYFDEQMPKLAEIIGVTWVGTSSAGLGAGGAGPGGFGMGGQGGPGPGLGGDSDDSGMDPSGGSGFGMGGMGGFGGPTGTTGRRNASRDVVIWPKASQDELLNSIRLWQGDKPDVYQMIYTQENVWILEGLFNIIAKTNIVPQTQKPATANIQAAVKQIEFIRIGAGALGDAGDVLFASGQAGMGMGGLGMGGFGFGSGSDSEDGGAMGGDDSGGGATGADYGDDGGMGTGGMSMDSGFGPAGMGRDGMEGPGGTQGRSIDPAHRRYVDASFQPISGDDLRTKIKSESPEDAYFAVAKRVPVRMRLTLDMRRFQEFLANCGNEGLMLEVRQVRIGNTTPAGTGAGGMGGGLAAGAPGRGMGSFGMGGPGDSGGDGGMGMDDFGDSGRDGGMGMGMGSMGMGGMGSGGFGSMQASRRSTHEMKVEVYGTVYLFYPVNIDRLGLNKVEEDFALQDSVQDAGQDAGQDAATPANSETTAPEAGGSGNNDQGATGNAGSNPGNGSSSNAGSSTDNNAGATQEGGTPGQPPTS